MKNLRLGLLCLLLAAVGCAAQSVEVKPKRISLLPPAMDVDALLPPVVVPAVATDALPHFRSIPIDEHATVCYPDAADVKKQACAPVEPGILVSEQTYAKSLVAESESKRFKTEVDVLRKLRLKEWSAVLQAESAYQDTVAELETQNARLREPSWWTQHSFEAGLVGGIVLTIAALATVGAALD